MIYSKLKFLGDFNWLRLGPQLKYLSIHACIEYYTANLGLFGNLSNNNMFQ